MPGSQEWEREKVSKVERLKERKNREGQGEK